MGRVWLGATHSSRPPRAGAATAEVAGPPTAERGARVPSGPYVDRVALPRPARRPGPQTEPPRSPLERRFRWMRWFGIA